MANVSDLIKAHQASVAELTDALSKAKEENNQRKKELEAFCNEMHKAHKQYRKELKDLNTRLESLKSVFDHITTELDGKVY